MGARCYAQIKKITTKADYNSMIDPTGAIYTCQRTGKACPGKIWSDSSINLPMKAFFEGKWVTLVISINGFEVFYIPLGIQLVLGKDIHTVFALHPEIFQLFR